AGVPNGGFDVDPYEANKAIGVSEKTAVIGSGGFVDVPVTLLRTGTESGLNHFLATITDSSGLTGRSFKRLGGKFQPGKPTKPAPNLATIINPTVSAGSSQTMSVSASDPDGPASGITLSATGLPSFVTFVNQGNGQGLFTFSPPAGTSPGTFSITVNAADSSSP